MMKLDLNIFIDKLNKEENVKEKDLLEDCECKDLLLTLYEEITNGNCNLTRDYFDKISLKDINKLQNWFDTCYYGGEVEELQDRYSTVLRLFNILNSCKNDITPNDDLLF